MVQKNLHLITKHFHKMTLEVTQRCNLRCRYCVYSGGYVGMRCHGSDDMTWDVARPALDYFLANRDHESGKASIGFYGGEAWLNWPLIRQCVAYLSERAPDVLLNSTTNGILLDDHLADYVAENNIELLISLDGPRELHDRNRVTAKGDGSFDRVWANVMRLRDRHAVYYAKSVRFQATLPESSDRELVAEFFISHQDVFAPGRVSFGDVSPGNRTFDGISPDPENPHSRENLEQRFRSKVIRNEIEDREAKSSPRCLSFRT